MEANKWITDKTFAYTLHETGRFAKGEPELCNKFYFRVYPDYSHGVTDEDAAKVVSELISAKEERDSLIEMLEILIPVIEDGISIRSDRVLTDEYNCRYDKAKELLNNLKK